MLSSVAGSVPYSRRNLRQRQGLLSSSTSQSIGRLIVWKSSTSPWPHPPRPGQRDIVLSKLGADFKLMWAPLWVRALVYVIAVFGLLEVLLHLGGPDNVALLFPGVVSLLVFCTRRIHNSLFAQA